MNDVHVAIPLQVRQPRRSSADEAAPYEGTAGTWRCMSQGVWLAYFSDVEPDADRTWVDKF